MGKIGIYGGTFNPPHAGHMAAAQQAISLLKLDKLLIIPDGQPPHKDMPEGTPPAELRLELTRLAATGLAKAEVLDVEAIRPGKSYTADTLAALHRRYPEDNLYLIMGTDMLMSFPQWHDPAGICAMATLAVLLREERDPKVQDTLQAQAQIIRKKLGGKVKLLKNNALPMSSTDVRRMLVSRAQGQMVAPAVLEIIQREGLYGVNRNRRGLSMEELEREVKALLDPKRIPHVLGCRDTAAKLARQYGADVTDAARAGLLHDITKALPPELQLQLCRAYGIPLDAFGQENPKTLHALTGAWVAREIFGENQAVFRAIESHTTGCAGMDTLQKIIYIADYMEPNRDFPGVERLRQAAQTDLDRAVCMGLEMTVDTLRQQGRRVARDSLQAIAWLKQ